MPGILKIEDLPSFEELEEKQEELLRRLSEKSSYPKRELMEKVNLAQLFLVRNFALLELQDRNLVMNSGKKMIQIGVFGILATLVVNIGLGPGTNYYFFKLPRYLRFGVRFGIFAAPAYLYAMHNKVIYERINWYLLDKYMDRIEIYMKLEDPKIINPNFEEELES